MKGTEPGYLRRFGNGDGSGSGTNGRSATTTLQASIDNLLYSAFRPASTGAREVCVSIDLTKIDDQPVSFAERVELDADRLDPDQVAGPVSVRLQGRVMPVGDGFLVDGDIEATGELVCTRCLQPVAWQGRDRFSVSLRVEDERANDDELELADDDLDVIFLDDPVLDLEHLAAEQVMLNLPMRILCQESCAGLCQRCGANLNEPNACTCEPEVDPRWQELKDIKGRPS